MAIREELQDPLTPVLALGATASAVVGSVVDAALVGTVLTGNAFVSGVQRHRAERALRRLMAEQTLKARRVAARTADVREVLERAGRDTDLVGRELESLRVKSVPAPRLAPGDVIALQSSEVVPADARLLAAWDLEVDESTLTGESVPVAKAVDRRLGHRCPSARAWRSSPPRCWPDPGTPSSWRPARRRRQGGPPGPRAGPPPPREVQARLAEITRMALPATALGGAGVAALGLLRTLPLRQAIAAGVSVAVAAVPEGLPLVATVAQAGAARRLSRRGVLVRSSRTLEALGRVDTVCFDKTGTLTTGRLVLTRVAGPHEELDLEQPAARRVLAVAARACPTVEKEDIENVPHATDRAVLEAASDAVEDDWEPTQESHFEASRGYSASLGTSNGTAELAVKGAPEVVLPLCTSVVDGDGAEPRSLDEAGRRTTEETVRSSPTRACGCSPSPNAGPAYPTRRMTSSRWSRSSA